MRKGVALILALLLLPVLPSGSAESSLLEVGIVETVDGRLVHFSFSSENTILTVNQDGNMSEYFWGNGELIFQWGIELNTTVKSASPDSTGLLVAVAHTEGVYIVNTELRIVTKFYNTTTAVDSVLWDTQGNLWFGHFGGERKALEWDDIEWTGISTESHNTGMTALLLWTQDQIITAGRDNLVKFHSQDGTVVRTLSDYSSFPTFMARDAAGDLLVGCSNGHLLRYDSNDFSKEELTISSDESIFSINFAANGEILVGTQNGKMHTIDGSTFTELKTYSSPGRVINGFYGPDGELFVVSTFSTSSKFRLYDLDSDGDGTTDSQDAFPADPTQTEDSDGDGFGDEADGNEADAFPDDFSQWADTDGDGHGDNIDGNSSDQFPFNPDQWQDSDGDGYGDEMNGEQGDRYPEDSSQWADRDFDGYGDNFDGFNGDACPDTNGFSTLDRLGCPDSDRDGYSDPTDNWSGTEGADTMINDISQWSDLDGDGYGDNLTGNQPDSCPTQPGTSTKAWLPTVSEDGEFTLVYSVHNKYGCEDRDGDGFYDLADDMPDNPNEYRDEDGDEVGYSLDYDDTNILIQTHEGHCLLNFTDVSESCRAYRDEDYQIYVTLRENEEKPVLGYSAWQRSLEVGDSPSATDAYVSTASEIAPYLGAGFGIILVLVLMVGAMGRSRKKSKIVKEFGGFSPDTISAEKEALGGKSQSMGGVDSDKLWEDEVEPMDLSVQEEEQLDGDDEFDDFDLKSDEIAAVNSDVLTEEKSLEELAGMPVSEPSPEPITEQAPQGPPVPADGLPTGWTMDQWQWYGEEYLAKLNK
ncbi:MAG TPA: hypothetical protein EYQ73_00315 [Candidatus Poseidoniales archaeon]|nr:hypothetical protein [Candidatus Poseidoniales archaeon]